jgi:hypothetical protein
MPARRSRPICSAADRVIYQPGRQIEPIDFRRSNFRSSQAWWRELWDQSSTNAMKFRSSFEFAVPLVYGMPEETDVNFKFTARRVGECPNEHP